MRRSVGDDVQSAETLIRPGRLHRLGSASKLTRRKTPVGELPRQAPLQLIGTPLAATTRPSSSRAIVSASWSASSKYCVVKRIVILRPQADGRFAKGVLDGQGRAPSSARPGRGMIGPLDRRRRRRLQAALRCNRSRCRHACDGRQQDRRWQATPPHEPGRPFLEDGGAEPSFRGSPPR